MSPSALNQQRYASARDAVCLGRFVLPHDHAHLRFSSQLVIGYGSGPVCSSREVGASCVTAPAPAGRPPAPPSRRPSNRLVWLQVSLFLEDLPTRGAA